MAPTMSLEPYKNFPLSIEEWNSLDPESPYHVDYSSSQYKGKKFLLYLFNIGQPASIENIPEQEMLQLIQDYVTFQRLVSIDSLNDRILDIIIENQQNGRSDAFFDKIGIVIYSIYCYAKRMVLGESIEFPKVISSIRPLSKNVVSLINASRYWEFISMMENIKTNPIYFDEFFECGYFSGKNIVDLFLMDFNPITITYMMNMQNLEE